MEIIFNSNGQDSLIKDEDVSADRFRRYIIESISELSIDDESQLVDESLVVADDQFREFSRMDLEELSLILNELDRKGGYQVLDNIFIKETQELKMSVLLPLPEVVNSNKLNDLRPIITLPTIEKILVRFVYEQLN
ncbi:hypothetical protein HHI36_003031 [Cryptolaemus montrouzieri]|uniref:Uncharacterized protein n=1 Tax=Cryptolaemus montrouzieri TaxID=559131 RepID=A0ABD2PCV3_9CUCU